MIHAGGAGYEIEFVTLAGERASVVTVPAEAVRPVRAKEIARAAGGIKRRLRPTEPPPAVPHLMVGVVPGDKPGARDQKTSRRWRASGRWGRGRPRRATFHSESGRCLDPG